MESSKLGNNTKSQTYYEILGVAQTSSLAEIESAYRRLALQYHPDKLGSGVNAQLDSRFHNLTLIKTTLTNPTLRQQYDSTLTRIANLDAKQNEERLNRQKVKFEWKHGLERSFNLIEISSRNTILSISHSELIAMALPESQNNFYGKKLPGIALTRKKLAHLLTLYILENIGQLEIME